jgi:hypothetical protein
VRYEYSPFRHKKSPKMAADIYSEIGQPGHISRDCTNPAAEGAGRGGGGGGFGGGSSQECYKVIFPLRE